MAGFFLENHQVSLFYQNLIKMIFFKNSEELDLERIKPTKKASDIDFRAPGGREFLWTTGEIEFSSVHCKVPKQPNLKFSFQGLQPSS
jgi:hypothetical protein